jgi:peptide methionine sulfoxide reductase MsrB
MRKCRSNTELDSISPNLGWPSLRREIKTSDCKNMEELVLVLAGCICQCDTSKSHLIERGSVEEIPM